MDAHCLECPSSMVKMVRPNLIKDFDARGTCRSCGTVHYLVQGDLMTSQQYEEDRVSNGLYERHLQP